MKDQFETDSLAPSVNYSAQIKQFEDSISEIDNKFTHNKFSENKVEKTNTLHVQSLMKLAP